ncbi:uncharacterized protein LOC115027676 [Cottoperca gobio]|uniref:Uncharacterized protein LOC115027676 n=1 Tax=Cottoperca gobio TaxID=56716 RepID=A0A6J2S5W1_COTGO|nr:uncharacterized protein LOC115027676 [Cottoperca gobio]
MPRKKDTVKGGAPIARIRENSRLMRTHETMVDFINGHHSANSILDVFASGLLGLDLLRTFEGELEDDIIYTDDDDDDDDDEDDHFYQQNAAQRPLEPHPRIKQLTDEEADKQAKELLEEEERRKEKTEKNKRKKLRKKLKKRLGKENAVKDILPEEQGKSGSSENPVIESNAEANESLKPVKTHNGDAAESSSNNKEENVAEMNAKEDEKQDLNINISYASTTKLEPEVMCDERPAREEQKKTTKLLEVQQLEEEKPKVVEKPEVKRKKEKHEEQKPMDPTAEELAKRSRELAGMGNRLAASSQYEMAVKCFTDAIKYNPKEFKLFGNRSLCYEIPLFTLYLWGKKYVSCRSPINLGLPPGMQARQCGNQARLLFNECLTASKQQASHDSPVSSASLDSHLMKLHEMGFSWAQSSEALKTHGTLEEAVEALFAGEDSNPGSCRRRGQLGQHGAAGGAGREEEEEEEEEEEDDDEGEWIVRQTSRPRMQQVKEFDAFGHSRSKSPSPTPHSRNSVKPDLFSVWVGSLAPAVTYSTLHELFSR